jgi:hypothetical protein
MLILKVSISLFFKGYLIVYAKVVPNFSNPRVTIRRGVVAEAPSDELPFPVEQPPGEATPECPAVSHSLVDGREFHRGEDVSPATVDD